MPRHVTPLPVTASIGWRTFLIVFAMLLTTVPRHAAAESLSEEPPRFFQVRTTDRRIAIAIDAGLRASATFRALVNYINSSNVVVYVSCDRANLPLGLDGRLTFLSATGGFRYVVVRVNSTLPFPRLVSLIGHELQHAVEIADTAAIVDDVTLGRAYAAKLGFTNRTLGYDIHAYDSAAAVRAGELILREVLGPQ
jgi:hypothetical protein